VKFVYIYKLLKIFIFNQYEIFNTPPHAETVQLVRLYCLRVIR